MTTRALSDLGYMEHESIPDKEGVCIRCGKVHGEWTCPMCGNIYADDGGRVLTRDPQHRCPLPLALKELVIQRNFGFRPIHTSRPITLTLEERVARLERGVSQGYSSGWFGEGR